MCLIITDSNYSIKQNGGEREVEEIGAVCCTTSPQGAISLRLCRQTVSRTYRYLLLLLPESFSRIFQMVGNLVSTLMYLFILNYYLSKLHTTCLKIKLYLKGNNEQWHIHLHNQPLILLCRAVTSNLFF